MLDFQVSTIVFTVINLLVLYFILRKLLFGRVNAVLEQRAARVKETIDSAEASKSQAEELRAEYEDKLTDARQEAAKLVADAQNRAQRAYEAKMADAETDAKRMRSEAEAQIASERDAMLRGARNEVASLALLPEIVEAFHGLELARRGGARCVLTCVHPLEAEELEKLRAALCRLHHKKEIVFDVRTDPALLGGFTLDIEGVRYDKSVRGALGRMGRQLEERRMA